MVLKSKGLRALCPSFYFSTDESEVVPMTNFPKRNVSRSLTRLCRSFLCLQEEMTRIKEEIRVLRELLHQKERMNGPQELCSASITATEESFVDPQELYSAFADKKEEAVKALIMEMDASCAYGEP